MGLVQKKLCGSEGCKERSWIRIKENGDRWRHYCKDCYRARQARKAS